MLPVAFRLETGLHQLGLKPYDLEHGSHLSHLFDVRLVMTQLARAKHEEMITKQIERFEAMRTLKLRTSPASIAHSGAIFSKPIRSTTSCGPAMRSTAVILCRGDQIR